MVDFPWEAFVQTYGQPANVILRLHSLWSQLPYIEWKDFCANSVGCRALVNTRSRVAILNLSARYVSGVSQTHSYRVGRDNTSHEHGRYYHCHSTMAKLVRQFLNNDEYADFKLILDVSGIRHQSGLFISRKNNRYSIYGYDPNNGSVANCMRKMSREISPTIETLPVWSTWSSNHDELCFPLTWRFFHAIMIDGYDPLRNELIQMEYNFRTKNTYAVLAEPEKSASIGYIESGEKHFVCLPRY